MPCPPRPYAVGPDEREEGVGVDAFKAAGQCMLVQKVRTIGGGKGMESFVVSEVLNMW